MGEGGGDEVGPGWGWPVKGLAVRGPGARWQTV
jgi:hypothetical protein